MLSRETCIPGPETMSAINYRGSFAVNQDEQDGNNHGQFELRDL